MPKIGGGGPGGGPGGGISVDVLGDIGCKDVGGIGGIGKPLLPGVKPWCKPLPNPIALPGAASQPLGKPPKPLPRARLPEAMSADNCPIKVWYKR